MKPRIVRTYGPSSCGDGHRRWELETLEALADNDVEKMRMVWNTPSSKLNSTVVRVACAGAPLSYGNAGFYDGSHANASYTEAPLIQKAVDGDTALHLAIRSLDAPMILFLIKIANVDLKIENSEKENALTMLGDLSTRIDDFEKMKDQREIFVEIFKDLQPEFDKYYIEVFNYVKSQMIEIYNKYCPHRISKIPMQMEQYKGKEKDLLALIKKKYED